MANRFTTMIDEIFETYGKKTDKYIFLGYCNAGAEYEGGDARYYCGMCEKHAAIRYHYVGDLLSKVRDAKKAIPSVHMMKPEKV